MRKVRVATDLPETVFLQHANRADVVCCGPRTDRPRAEAIDLIGEHAATTLALAFKWQRILWRCWQDHQPYDESVYLRSLRDRNPTLHQLALNTLLPKEKAAA